MRSRWPLRLLLIERVLFFCARLMYFCVEPGEDSARLRLSELDSTYCLKARSMKKIFLLLCVVMSGFSAPARPPSPTSPAPQARQKIVTAAQANGVYRYYQSEFRILALGHNKLKVQFDGVYPTLAKSVNLGYAMGEATIDGNIATFKPPNFEQCVITIVFLPGKLKVTQQGDDADCGFGHNVNAAGTYRKIRGGKPKFESPEGI